MASPASRTTAVTRVLLVALALLAAGWLAVSWRDVRLQDQGIRLFQATPTQARAALSKFHAAGRLNASRQPRQFEAASYWVLGERERAVAMLKDLLRQEPDNRIGWVLLSNWLRASDPAAAAAAARRAEKLNGKPASRTP